MKTTSTRGIGSRRMSAAGPKGGASSEPSQGSAATAPPAAVGSAAPQLPSSPYLQRVAKRSEDVVERRMLAGLKEAEERRRLGLEPTTRTLADPFAAPSAEAEFVANLDRGKRDIVVSIPTKNEVRVYRRARTDVKTNAVLRSLVAVPVDLDLFKTAATSTAQQRSPTASVAQQGGRGQPSGAGEHSRALSPAAADVAPASTATDESAIKLSEPPSGGTGDSAVTSPSLHAVIPRGLDPSFRYQAHLPQNFIAKPCNMNAAMSLHQSDVAGTVNQEQWAMWVTERQRLPPVDPNAGRGKRRRIHHHRRSCKYNLYSTNRDFRVLSLQSTFPSKALRESLSLLRHAVHGGSNGDSVDGFDINEFFVPMTTGWWDEEGRDGAGLRSSPLDHRDSAPGNASLPPPIPALQRAHSSFLEPGASFASNQHQQQRRLSAASSDMGRGPSMQGSQVRGDATGSPSTGPALRQTPSEAAMDDGHAPRRESSSAASPAASVIAGGPSDGMQAALRRPSAAVLASEYGDGDVVSNNKQQSLPAVFVFTENSEQRAASSIRPQSRMSERCRTPDVSRMQRPPSRPHEERRGEYWDCSCTDRSTDDELDTVKAEMADEYGECAEARLGCLERGFAKTKVLARSRLGSRLGERTAERNAVCSTRRHFAPVTHEAERAGEEWRINRQNRSCTPSGSSMWHVCFENARTDLEALNAARDHYVTLCDNCAKEEFPSCAADEAVAEIVRQRFVARYHDARKGSIIDSAFVRDLLFGPQSRQIFASKAAIGFVDVLRHDAKISAADFFHMLEDRSNALRKEAELARVHQAARASSGGGAGTIAPAIDPVCREVDTLMRRLAKHMATVAATAAAGGGMAGPPGAALAARRSRA